MADRLVTALARRELERDPSSDRTDRQPVEVGTSLTIRVESHHVFQETKTPSSRVPLTSLDFVPVEGPEHANQEPVEIARHEDSLARPSSER
jgi:hypothetical protein